jgi:hypothetical protein
VQGAAQDIPAVTATIAPKNVIVSKIVFGIGGAFKFQASLRNPGTIDNPHVCAEGSGAIVEVLRQLQAAAIVNEGNKPSLIAISTTGITKRKGGDIPLAMKPFYHWVLSIPHQDKLAMEQIIMSAEKEGLLRSFVFVRPAYLIDNEAKGLQKIRVGWELPGQEGVNDGETPGPAVGYAITRADVGAWIFEKAVKESGFEGKCVSITY